MKKLLAFVTACTMAVPVIVTVGCGEDAPEKPTGINLLEHVNYWEVNDEEDSIYQISSTSSAPLHVEYTKTGSTWQYFKYNLGIYEPSDLQGLKTLVLEGDFTVSSNDPMVTLKLEYSGGLAPQEVKFSMDRAEKRYEWDVSDLQVEKAQRLLVFLEGNRSTGTGTFNATKFEFTADDTNEKYTVARPKIEMSVKTITAEDSKVDAGWYDNGDGVYTVTKQGTEFKVDYSKKSNEYAIIKALVKGSALSAFKTVKLTVQGTEGTRILIKPYDKVEKTVTLTGGVDEFFVDVSGVKDVDFAAELPVMLFVEPGAMDKTGSFTIKSCEFSTEAIPAPPKKVNEITAENTAVSGWYSSTEGNYELSQNNDGSLKVTKVQAEQFSGLAVDVKGEALKDMKVFKVVLNGDFKAVKVEQIGSDLLSAVELKNKSGDVEIVCKVKSDLSAVDFTKVFTIKIFFNWDEPENGKGQSYTIKSAAFSDVDQEINEITATDKTANAGWYDVAEKPTHQITKEGSSYIVEYDQKAGEEWANIQAFVTGAALKDMKTVNITVQGVKGTQIMLKPFNDGSLEKTFTLTGGVDTFTVDISKFTGAEGKDFSGKLPVILFIAPNALATGTLTISNLEFSTEAAN